MKKSNRVFCSIAVAAILVLSAVNIAMFIEANTGAGIFTQTVMATSGAAAGVPVVTTDMASVITVGAGVIVGAGAAIWLVNFFRRMNEDSTPASAARSATRASKNELRQAKKTIEREVGKGAKKVERTRRAVKTGAAHVAKTTKTATKSAARAVKKDVKKAGKTVSSSAKRAAANVKKAAK